MTEGGRCAIIGHVRILDAKITAFPRYFNGSNVKICFTCGGRCGIIPPKACAAACRRVNFRSGSAVWQRADVVLLLAAREYFYRRIFNSVQQRRFESNLEIGVNVYG